ncbi:ABC transporter permease [Streptomyces purpureus]|uniref:Transporter n=1 Tax=Streptomyces purpureus TaxID=1951 RepID=A0A918HD00_9ACTN|nr:ABC transporter permease [Streptomyces purpureus]GGT55394.1 transporter [Streptomyces purpureus]
MSTLLSPTGPRWVVVRQHRTALWTAAAAVAASAALVTALRMWDDAVPGTNQDNGYALLRIGMDYAAMLLLALPLLIGAFVAGPMVARELESGTYKLALTQSVTPRRWLASKLVIAVTVTAVGTLALMGVFALGRSRVANEYLFSWDERGTYEATGTVLLSYCLLAVAVGALVGQLVRRTLVAMAATGVVLGVVQLVLTALRWDFLPVRTLTGPYGADLLVPDEGLYMDSGLISTSGQRLPGWYCPEPLTENGICRSDVDIAAQYIDYHPASHFWPTQLIETGIVLALTALVLAAAFKVLRARHA